MRLYEQMDPLERKIMILEAVGGSTSIEGMDKAAQECFEEAAKLRKMLRQKQRVVTSGAGEKVS